MASVRTSSVSRCRLPACRLKDAMGAYIIRRLVQAIPTLFLITAIVFLVVYFIPGDPAAVDPRAGRDAGERWTRCASGWGSNDPLPVRYGVWLEHVAPGRSRPLHRQQTAGLDADRPRPADHALPDDLFPRSSRSLIAIPSGTIAALKRNTWIDLVCTTCAFLGLSIPGFWLAIMFVYLFGVRLQWVPLQGYISPREDLGDSLKTMILPAFTLGVFLSGPLTRYLRSSILQTISQEFVLVARAKGLAERKVLFGHILRNSLIPFVTVLGIQFGYLLGGAVVIENVFALPGIGDLAVSAIGDRDLPGDPGRRPRRRRRLRADQHPGRRHLLGARSPHPRRPGRG